MKLYLASFLEKHNFGSGRLISVADGSRPDHLKCDLVFEHFIPSAECSKKYSSMQLSDPKNAGKAFVKQFTKELDEFYDDIVATAAEEELDPQDLLPFKEGDTLASWQREMFTHYRDLIAICLQKLGYEVVSK